MTANRITLPQEFYDKTSDMVLKAPLPQFPYARMLFMAYAQAELAEGEGQPYGPNGRKLPTDGADAENLADNQLLLSDETFGGAIMVNLELLAPGAVGHTVRMNRPVFTGGSYTEAARAISSQQTISTTPIDLAAQQTTLTVVEVGGPMSSTGTVIQPYAISAVDAKRSVHSLSKKVGTALAYDRMKYCDAVLSLRYTTSSNSAVYPNNPGDAITTDATAFVANGDRPFTCETIWKMEKVLDAANVPTFQDGTRILMVDTQQALDLKNDTRFQRLVVNDPARNPLGESSIGRVGNVRVVKSNTNQTDTTTVSGVTIRKATMFGPGAIGYAPGEVVHVEPADDTDYGRQVKVVWRGMEGFQNLDASFICIAKSN
jgi:hypothetical protein